MILPLGVGEIYVVVTDDGPWRQYPISTDLVRCGTITTVYEPINSSEYVLVCHNSPPQMRQVNRSSVFIFNYSEHSRSHAVDGLKPAFS